MAITRIKIQVTGIVQGVGFRPHVYLLAGAMGLSGRVLNNEAGVLIDIEGEPELINQFVSELKSRAPALSRIESLQCTDGFAPAHYTDFQIIESAVAGHKFVPISPDVATCADCLRELFDPLNRRYRYPFINCTNCGPRFTIIEDVPYDREKTTMREFAMCAECRSEYENPLDRRFHAEPTACVKCGPQLFLIGPGGASEKIADPLAQSLALLAQGKILAIKGIGGFHLACDALSHETVEQLRHRKYREDKPFALMASSLDVIRRYCAVSEAEAQLLQSPPRPIVLLNRTKDADIPDAVAPRVKTLGFMLPYSPLHHLLFEGREGPLVMTSANVSDEPICYQDDDAQQRLVNIADYHLLHNRRIHMRTDDSVVRVISIPCWPDKTTARAAQDSSQPVESAVLRRSRGYAPAPIKTGFRFGKQILGCGAELKNTFCLTRGEHAFVSHHIGDLENFETLRSFRDGIEHFKRLFYLNPELIAYDLHPEYLSTKYAQGLDPNTPKIGVQHHHAHIASCMADNQIDGDVIGVAMDGLGYGSDGRMWGGEFFIASFAEANRVAHLEYMPMPGGAKAIREPWRMTATYLWRTFGDDFQRLSLPFNAETDAKSWNLQKRMIQSHTNCPDTSSMGRLFDAIASLLRLRDVTNYEGQAAIELEQIADHNCAGHFEFDITDDNIIRAQTIIRSAVAEILNGAPAAEISAKFHLGVAHLILRLATRIRDEQKLNRVVMSGGVFQNVFLLRAARRNLTEAGFEVFTHRRVPTNDGGISLGQVAIANYRMPS